MSEYAPVRAAAGAPQSGVAPARSARLSTPVRRAFGPLLPLVDRPELRDVLLQVRDGAAALWIDRSGRLERITEFAFDVAGVRALAVALVAAGGRQLDELHPCADVHVGAGIRVHAVLPPVSTSGAAVSIRLPSLVPLSLHALVQGGLCDHPTERLLREAVQRRRNLLITGGTGSGKTTLLAALLGLAPPDERIITIEDLAELRPHHPHHLALEARPPNAEGAGELSVDRLLREALRMRPDRIVLGECRGPEITTLLTALNTGHDGGAGTLHANRLGDVAARLEALGMMAGLTPETLARQAVSALHLIVHLRRDARAGSRIEAIGTLSLVGDRLVVAP